MMISDYNALLLEHFNQPRNVGTWPTGTAHVLTGRSGTKGVSDEVLIQCRYVNDVIIDARFKAYGNPYTIAGASLATECLKDKSIDQLNALDHNFFINQLQIPQTKWHCAILIEDAIRAVEQSYRAQVCEEVC